LPRSPSDSTSAWFAAASLCAWSTCAARRRLVLSKTTAMTAAAPANGQW